MGVTYPGYVSSSRSRGLLRAAQTREPELPVTYHCCVSNLASAYYQWLFDGHCDELLRTLFNGGLNAPSCRGAVKRYSSALISSRDCFSCIKLPPSLSCLLPINADIKVWSLWPNSGWFWRVSLGICERYLSRHLHGVGKGCFRTWLLSNPAFFSLS